MILVERWVEGDRKRPREAVAREVDRAQSPPAPDEMGDLGADRAGDGGGRVFYFTDAPTLAVNLLNGTAHPVAYTTIAVLTLTTVVLGGFMREQVCIYMCPWPRIRRP